MWAIYPGQIGNWTKCLFYVCHSVVNVISGDTRLIALPSIGVLWRGLSCDLHVIFTIFFLYYGYVLAANHTILPVYEPKNNM